MTNANAEIGRYITIKTITGNIRFSMDFHIDSFWTSDIPIIRMANVHIPMATCTKAENAYTTIVITPLP